MELCDDSATINHRKRLRTNFKDPNENDAPLQLKSLFNTKMTSIFGMNSEPVQGKLNHIYFDDDITKYSCRQLINQIDDLNIKIGKLSCEYDIDTIPKIYLHISSYGGSIFAALNVIDAMRCSKYPIVTIVEGAVASAATLISVSGHERWITQHGHMLIHQLTSACWGKMTEIEDEFENLKNLMDHILDIYEKKTHLTKPQLRKLLKHDRWWDAKYCLEQGLVDKII